MYYIDQARNNPNQKVVITIPTVGTVTTYLSGEFSLGASAEYESMFAAFQNTKAGAMAESALEMFNQASSFMAGVTGQHGHRFGNSLSRAVRWKDSTVESINLPINLVNIDGNDIRDDMKMLYKSVLPQEATLATLLPPLGYDPNVMTQNYDSGEGLITLDIGQWFKARKLLMRQVNFSISRETDKKGLPLFASGEISFQPATLVDYQEFEKWLRR